MREEWVTVQRRRRQGEKVSLSHVSDLSKIATTLYVQNIPVGWDSAALWKGCKSFGTIVDAFVARKKDRFGGNFGFVRYIKVKDIEGIIYKINCIQNNNGPLKANIARFSKDGVKINEGSMSKPYMHSRDGDDKRAKPAFNYVGSFGNVRSKTEGKLHCSFKDAVTGGTCKAVDNTRLVKEKMSISIPSGLNFNSFEWLGNCLIGVLKDVDLLAKCFSIFHSTGIGECSVIYLGGLSVLLRFENPRVASAFLEEHRENWSFWFEGLRKWSDGPRATFRAVWIKIFGVPVTMWNDVVFHVIAEKLGRILIPFECNPHTNNMSCARMCILTSKKQLLNHDSIEVCWRNNKFEICIKEDGEWCPPFSNSVKDFNNNNMGDSDIESKERLDEDGRNNSEDGYFIEDTGSDPLFNNERVSAKDVSDSKANDNTEKVDSTIDAGVSHAHEISGKNNEDSLQSVAETLFEINDGGNVQSFTGDTSGNFFNKIGPKEINGSRDHSIISKSDGLASPNGIPDLNNPIRFSEPIKRIKLSHMHPAKRAFSLKFKDIISSANQGKKHLLAIKKATHNLEKVDLCCNSTNSRELSSSSSEIAKTMQVGVSIGYQMEGAEQIIEDILKGEGDKLKSK